jgi:hypothetical protein
MEAVETSQPNFDSVWRALQELVAASKETDRKFQETRLMFQETDRKFQETDRKFQETERMIKATNKQLGAQGNRLGEFVQEMVRPAVVGLFRARNIPVHQVVPNITAFDDNGQFRSEIDLLVVNSETAIAVECKSHLSQADVDEHLERLAIFKDCFPQYSALTILGAVAAMVMSAEVGRYAYRKGLFVLAQSGEMMEIRNGEGFVPAQW